MRHLKLNHGVNRLLCEGGGELNDALFRADLVDEIRLTVCPVIIGGRTAPTISDGTGFAQLAGARNFELASRRTVGDEIYLTYRRKR
jgi:5-amino-6-(5-phosphoribosylamino)uracil reductase